MRIDGRQVVGIFARTFAAMAGATLLAAQGYVWASSSDYRANALLVGLGLLAAAIGGLLAVGAALAAGPAETRNGKAFRAFLEKLLAGVGVVAFSEIADVIAFGKLLPPLLVASVLAFGVTWLTYAETPTPGSAPAGTQPT